VTDTIYALLAIAMVLTVSLLVPLAERFLLPHRPAGNRRHGAGLPRLVDHRGDIKLGALGDAFVGLDKLEVGLRYSCRCSCRHCCSPPG
jgi:CPA1 family monovalent cation:H+ antiporter